VIPLCAGAGGFHMGRRMGWRRPYLAAGVVAAAVVEPMIGAALAAVLAAWHRWQRAAAATRRERVATADVAVLADLVVLGLTAGLSLRSAVEEAARYIGEELRVEVESMRAAMDRDGVATALSLVGGHLAGFGRVAAAAAISGAPVAAAIGAYASTLRHTEHAAAVERARRLPVRMLLPLALLILPGFMVLAVGPAVLQSLARLGPVP